MDGQYKLKWLFEYALVGFLAATCLLTFLAIARVILKRRRTRFAYRAFTDERDTLAKFRRIMGRNTRA